MSKGLGHIEQEILCLLPTAPRGEADSVTLALMVYRVPIPEEYQPHAINVHDLVTNAQRSAVRRALVSLKRQGLIEDLGVKGWAKGRRHWRIAPDILQILAGDAEPHTGSRATFNRIILRDLRDQPLADQIRHVLRLPPKQRAREAADLIEAIASKARVQEMDAAEAGNDA